MTGSIGYFSACDITTCCSITFVHSAISTVAFDKVAALRDEYGIVRQVA